jgi:nucleoside-diphosphate-sugar epimerase
MHVLLAGFGFLGSQIHEFLTAGGHEMTVIRRKNGNQSLLKTNFVACDLTVTAPKLVRTNYDWTIFCLAPGSRDEVQYEAVYCAAQRNLLAGVSTGRYVYVSSTAVYPDLPGLYVEEAAKPHNPRAKILLEAESIAAGHPHVAILRLSGLYSRERKIYDKSQRTFKEDRLVHFIHKVDAARAVLHALENGLEGIYNIHDGNPQWRSDILPYMQQQTRIPNKNLDRIVNIDQFFASGYRPKYSRYQIGIEN